jgi:hypothetical protein
MQSLICCSYLSVDHCSYFELFIVEISNGCRVNQQENSVIWNNAQVVWGPEWPGHSSRRHRAGVNRDDRGRLTMRRGVATLKRVTTTRTTGATTTGADNIPVANNDNDFMPSPLAHLHSPFLRCY